MPTITTICNSALMKIGCNPINSLTDQTKEATTCSIRYSDCKQSVLRLHPWACAIKRVILAPDAVAPAYGYAYRFAIPPDFIRLVAVNPETESDYKIENGYVLGDFTTLYLKYVSDANENNLDPLVAEAIACYLAWDISYSLTQQMSVRAEMGKDKKDAISKAKLANAQELPSQEVEANYFLEARLGPVASNISERRNW